MDKQCRLQPASAQKISRKVASRTGAQMSLVFPTGPESPATAPTVNASYQMLTPPYPYSTSRPHRWLMLSVVHAFTLTWNDMQQSGAAACWHMIQVYQVLRQGWVGMGGAGGWRGYTGNNRTLLKIGPRCFIVCSSALQVSLHQCSQLLVSSLGVTQVQSLLGLRAFFQPACLSLI